MKPAKENAFAVKFIPAGSGRTESALVRVVSEGIVLCRGNHEEIVPYAAASLARSESSRAIVELRTPVGTAMFLAADRDLTAAIFRSESEKLRESLREILEDLRPLHQIVLHGSLLTIVLLLAATGITQGLTALGRNVLMRCPPSWEVKLGNAAYAAAGASTESDNRILQDAVQKVAEPLLRALPASDYPIHLHVSTASQVNAVAYPGGQIVIYSGLIAETRTPEELAGVIAHELSHMMLRHSLQALGNKFGISALVYLLPFGFDSNEHLLGIVPDLLSLRYTRAQEEEADLGGGALLRRAHISADGMVSFFQRMADEEKSLPTAFGFLSSHPTSADRAEYLAAIAKEQPSERFRYDIDWPAIRKEAGVRQTDEHFQLGRAAMEESMQ